MDNGSGASAPAELRPDPAGEQVAGGQVVSTAPGEDLLAASPVPHLVLGADARCESCNAALSRLLGLPATEVAGTHYLDLLDADEAPLVPTPGAPLEQRLRTPRGGELWAVVSAGALPRGRRLLSVQDVTARRHTEHNLTHDALHDSLTDLPNRRLLHDRLTTALARSERSHETVAVIFLDLDGFKTVNDTHGHHVGDALLVAIAGHLAAGLRACDTVARLGGDEFVVVCSDLDGQDSLSGLTTRVREAVRRPISVEGVPMAVTASLGVAVAGPWARTPAALLRLADVAMYHAKADPSVAYVLADDALAAALARATAVPRGDGADRRAPATGSRGLPVSGGPD